MELNGFSSWSLVNIKFKKYNIYSIFYNNSIAFYILLVLTDTVTRRLKYLKVVFMFQLKLNMDPLVDLQFCIFGPFGQWS